MIKVLRVMLLITAIGLLFTFLYNEIPLLKQSVHFVLDPTAGVLLNYNVTLGMIIITAVISLILTIVQKYTTDQESLRVLKKEQKILQDQMKEFKDHPEKLMELQKKQLEFIPKTMELTMNSILYTAIPILLFFRWFYEYFTINDIKILGFLSWFWAYLIFSIIWSSIFRKIFKLA